MVYRSRSRMPSKHTIRGAAALTMLPKYSNVCPYRTEHNANHVECGNTPHGSNPTLGLAVTGLQRIIHAHMASVLRNLAALLTHGVCWGRVVFRFSEVD